MTNRQPKLKESALFCFVRFAGLVPLRQTRAAATSVFSPESVWLFLLLFGGHIGDIVVYVYVNVKCLEKTLVEVVSCCCCCCLNFVVVISSVAIATANHLWISFSWHQDFSVSDAAFLDLNKRMFPSVGLSIHLFNQLFCE